LTGRVLLLSDRDDSRTVRWCVVGSSRSRDITIATLRAVWVQPMLFHHNAVSPNVWYVVDVEIAISTRQHQPSLPAQCGYSDYVGDTSRRDCDRGKGSRLVQCVSNLAERWFGK